jgi:hypothetical protein
MTCIVAVRSKTGVIIGGDSAGVAGYRLNVRSDPKVFRCGPFAMGFTSSFRMGQILAHGFEPPKPPKKGDALYRYMVNDFVEALRTALKAKGFAVVNNGQETGGTFLVGIRRRIFQIESDYQVGENAYGFDAVGCGAEIAMGALYTDRYGIRHNPQWYAKRALMAAEALNAGVRGPFRFVETP